MLVVVSKGVVLMEKVYNYDYMKTFGGHLDEISPRWPPTNNFLTYANIMVRHIQCILTTVKL